MTPNATSDPKRVYGGFTVLDGGMNGGIAASLLPANQCAASRDFTFRDGFPRTRPPWANILLTFANASVQTNFTGKFQGAIFYQSFDGNDGFVCSVGGRLFRIILTGSNAVVSEITPLLSIVTTKDFTVPALHATVSVFVNNDDIFTVGQNVIIDSGLYAVSALFTGQMTLTYNGSAAHATAPAGSAVQDNTGKQLFKPITNPAGYDFIHIFQAEQYAVVMGGQDKTIIFDGAIARTAGDNEIPPGWLGIYLWGRIWIVLPDRRSFVAGDLFGSSSGTASLNFRDAILKFTENTFLNGGGVFTLPNNAGEITSLSALATQDTSLGVGPLLVGTPNLVASVNTPVDRTTWQNLTYPIQTVSLIDYGPIGPRPQASINGDLWYRAIDGVRSFRVARQNMDMWGNTPMSREVQPLIGFDDKSLLFFGSSVFFDNKLFTTASPQRTPYGVVHQGLGVINFDLISSMRVKLQPAWEGAYTGLKIFQVMKGKVNGLERAFAFVLNTNATPNIELWEILTSGYYDSFTSVSGGITNITRTGIQPWLETRSDDFGDATQLKELYTAELYLDEIVDQVNLTIKWKSDQDPNWQTWTTLSLCANVSQCTIAAPPAPFQCSMWNTDGPQYAARIMIPRPPEACNVISGRPGTWGYQFQFRIEGQGHFRLRQFKPHAILKTDKMEGECPAMPVCKAVPTCDTNWFNYASR